MKKLPQHSGQREIYPKDTGLFGYEFEKHPGSGSPVNPREGFMPQRTGNTEEDA